MLKSDRLFRVTSSCESSTLAVAVNVNKSDKPRNLNNLTLANGNKKQNLSKYKATFLCNLIIDLKCIASTYIHQNNANEWIANDCVGAV